MSDVFCDPPVRNLPQWDARWGAQILHDDTTWRASGCHPSSVAMVLRWFAEDNAATRGTFQFPTKAGSRIAADHYSQRMCEAFWPSLGGKVNATGNNVDHTGLMNKAAAALGIEASSVLLSTHGDKLQTIQAALAHGPIVANMTHPGHFVVITGYRDGKLVITDPGNELHNAWAAEAAGAVGRPPQSQWPNGGPPSAGSEYDARAYVLIDPARTYTVTQGHAPNQTTSQVNFLASIIRMEGYRCNAVATTTTAHPTTTTAHPATTTTAHAGTTTTAQPAHTTTTASPPGTTTADAHSGGAPVAKASAEETTTAAPGNSTTAAPTTTTAAPSVPTTTTALVATTTAAPVASTTAAAADSTTAPPGDSTTAAPADSTTAAPENSTTAAPENSTTAPPDESTTAAADAGSSGDSASTPTDSTTAAPADAAGSDSTAPQSTTTAPPETTTDGAAGATIAPVDDVRASADLQTWDLEGNEGRWVDVPRLQQQNAEAPAQTSFWSGRAAAAMLYNYYSKFAGKADEYIGHADGDTAPGPNGIKNNLRWLGGANQGTLAGLTDGLVDLTQIFTTAGMQYDAGSLVAAGEIGLPSQAALRFQPIVDQLKLNNPVLLFTLLSRGPGHVIVISGYKLIGNGDLWLRVTDSDGPRVDYLPDVELITTPTAPDKMFSEYWIPATSLFVPHPTIEGARLYAYVGNPGKFMFIVPDAPVPDDNELVHRLAPRATQDAPGSTTTASPGSTTTAAPGGTTTAPPATTTHAPGTTTTAGPQPRPWAEVEPEVIAGDFKDAGQWKDGKFTNIDLQGLLEHYCSDDKLDPAAMGDGGSSKNAKGGDLPVTADDSLPTWYCNWRVKVAQRPKWDRYAQARSRIGEAFSRAFFRDLCEQKSAVYPPSADEFFANLWKSNGNGKSGDMGGPGGMYCAAASTLGFTRALAAVGYKVPMAKGTQVAQQCVLSKLKGVSPQPGDVLSIVSAVQGMPRTGHVVTVIVSLATDWDSGSIWVVSGNCGPRGNVAVDSIELEPRNPQFNPFKTDADGKLIGKWQPGEKKPSAGKVWVYADQRCSVLMPAKIGVLGESELNKLGISRQPPQETPGSKPGRIPAASPHGGAAAGADASGAGEPEAATTHAPEESTTQAPEESTTQAVPAPTTAAPTEATTQAPAPTTQAPTTTHAPPTTTTHAPTPTTHAPTTTTHAPTTTTHAPTPTTHAPTTTTHAPTPTTHAPTTTTHAPTTTTHAPTGKMTGSSITVGGKHFVDWFNEDFRPKYPGNHPTLLLWKKPAPMFPNKVIKANFIKIFDKLDKLWAPQLTVPEFLAFFGIFYNETGGTMVPTGEVGSAKYMFNATPGGKASYNTGGNRKAGDQLKAMGAISSAADVAAWNGTVYPDSASDAVKKAALQCDFYKYRGHGFIQTTFRPAYLSTVDPALKAAGYSKTCDQMTTEELGNVIQSDPNVSLPMVHSYYKAGCSKSMAAINTEPPNWYPIGRTVSGQKPYGDLYQWRCETIYAAMKKAGIVLK